MPNPTQAAVANPMPERWSLPRAKLLRRALRTNPTFEYEIYIPSTGAQDAPVLVAVHGLSRERNDQAAQFVQACESHGVILLAPRFVGDQHADYQRLGREGRGPRADLFLHACLQELSALTGVDTSQLYLFGHSGGAQFAHRYAMAYPHRVVRAAFSGAGWYTQPDPTQKYPYGIQPNRRLPGVLFDPEAYLKVPMTALVGAQDTKPEAVRSSDRLRQEQGANRMERAQHWVQAMAAQAAAHGFAPRVVLEVVPECGHDFAELCGRGGMVQRVFAALFEPRTDAARTPTRPPVNAPRDTPTVSHDVSQKARAERKAAKAVKAVKAVKAAKAVKGLGVQPAQNASPRTTPSAKPSLRDGTAARAA